MLKKMIVTNLLLFCFSNIGFAEGFGDSVVKIIITKQSFDHNSPWQKISVQKDSISGCVLQNYKIITEAYNLADHIFVEVSKHGSDRKFPARVLVKDYKLGLAVIEVIDKSFYKDLNPVSLYSESVMRGRRMIIGRWDESGIFKEYGASHIKTSVRFYQLHSAVLMHQLYTNLEQGGEGEPVFIGNSLAGICSWNDSKNKIANIISVEMIDKLLKDFSDGKYDGVPFYYLVDVGLKSDENLREYLGLGEKDDGVLVLEVPPTSSGYGVLMANDVILSIDGVNIDDNGMYVSKYWGRLNYYSIIYLNHSTGDIVNMTILRNKKKKQVSFKLLPYTEDCLMVETIGYDNQPEYIISGGLVFQELTLKYLQTWGNEWTKKANKRLMFYYEKFILNPSQEKKRLIILNRVLPASVNQGYHDSNNLILLSVNGKKATDLKHLKTLVDGADGRFIRFDFIGNYCIILDREKMKSDEKSILKKYNIHKSYYTGN